MDVKEVNLMNGEVEFRDFTEEERQSFLPERTDEKIISGIKTEAAIRIAEAIPYWMTQREQLGGTPVSQALKDYAADVRAASNALEVSLPQDFSADEHWPAKP
ncbi:MAG: hypothetical protein CBB87_07980 [Micavibrio sp. TMED27]|nr:hypothetical protein [Micavibrio sp.]OUT90609.1 MAG: hypothetical protein CBB87_07980 [Micavibrio sp. TMED27]|tara:strand:- start:171 stop:479 length:309 start_codon:yes stop_codon:yes gene_type:complete